MLAYGVYISNDIEIIVTDKYIITFRRVKSQNALESCLLEKEDPTSRYACVGICRSMPATTIDFPKPRKWEYAFQSAKQKFHNDKSLAERVGNPYPMIQQ